MKVDDHEVGGSCKTKRVIGNAYLLPVALYGCETLSPTSREEHRLTVFVTRVLRRIFGPKRDKVRGVGGNYIMRSTLHQVL
jgi:hypothetical protein